MVSVRVAALGVAALALTGTGIGVAATRDTSASGSETMTESPSPAATSTTLLEPTTTVPIPSASAPPTTTTAPLPSTTVRRATTTTAARATTTVPRSTTTTEPSGQACTPKEIAVRVTTDQPSYAPGREVKVTSTLRNTSSAPCIYNGYSVGTSFRDDPGRVFPGATVIADSFADIALRPGETLTQSATWDHRACAEPGCAPLPAGPYDVTVSWNFVGVRYDVGTSFILT